MKYRDQSNRKNAFAPVEAFIASLGSCAGINVIMLLEEKGVSPNTCTVKTECLISHQTPRTIEKIHLEFIFAGLFSQETAKTAITKVMTLICPIAVTVGKATSVTWECSISDNHPD